MKRGRAAPVRTFVIGIAVSAALLWSATRSIPLARVAQEIAQVSLTILSLSLLCKLVVFLVISWRTQLLMRRLERLPLGLAFRSHLVCFAGNNLLPLRAGELLRVDYLARKAKLAHAECLPVVGLERLLDLASLGLLALCITPFVSRELPLLPSVYLSIGLAAVGIGALVFARLRPELLIAVGTRIAALAGPRAQAFLVAHGKKLGEGLAALPGGADAVYVALLSLANWIVSTLSVAVWFWAFGLVLPWYAAPLTILFLGFGLALPASPGHIGTYHYFVAAALTAVGLDRTHALSVAVVGHAVAIVPFSIVAIPALIDAMSFRTPQPAPEQ